LFVHRDRGQARKGRKRGGIWARAALAGDG
jgi:hypothetical protein